MDEMGVLSSLSICSRVASGQYLPQEPEMDIHVQSAEEGTVDEEQDLGSSSVASAALQEADYTSDLRHLAIRTRELEMIEHAHETNAANTDKLDVGLSSDNFVFFRNAGGFADSEGYSDDGYSGDEIVDRVEEIVNSLVRMYLNEDRSTEKEALESKLDHVC